LRGDIVLPGGRATITYPSAQALIVKNAPVECFVVTPGTLRSDDVMLTRYEGTFDGHVEKPTSAESVRATAIIPKKLYVFRRCVEGCDRALGDPKRTESISIVARDALWAGTTDRTLQVIEGPAPKFFVVSAEVKPGASADVLFDLPNGQLVTGKKRDAYHAAATTYELDVVWPTGGEPEVTLFEGSVTGDSDRISSDYIYRRY
jgi:hypothetical protein